MTVTLYTTTTCPYCKMLRTFLHDNHIQFTEKLVDQDENAKSEMAEVSGGFMGVPFTVIKTDDGHTESIVGFDKGRLNEILGIS